MARGVKKGSKILFYTTKETELIRRISKNGKNHKENVELLSKRLNRSITGMAVKYREIRREDGNVRKIVRKENVEAKTIELTKGMVIDFPANRVLIEKNRIIIYI
jgi:alanyl-tRNA synthetase